MSVNEAHALTDALLHLTVEGTAASPPAAPAAPAEGDCWLVAGSASGDWTGYDGQIACRQSGTWLFVQPRPGMRAYNRAQGRDWRYTASGWQKADPIALPTGGATVDSQARTAIAALLQALTAAGILPSV